MLLNFKLQFLTAWFGIKYWKWWWTLGVRYISFMCTPASILTADYYMGVWSMKHGGWSETQLAISSLPTRYSFYHSWSSPTAIKPWILSVILDVWKRVSMFSWNHVYSHWSRSDKWLSFTSECSQVPGQTGFRSHPNLIPIRTYSVLLDKGGTFAFPDYF